MDYSGFDELIGRMKRAAIDCFMADQGFTTDKAQDNYYSYWGFLPNGYTKPDADGSGGGEPHRLNWGDENIGSTFDSIRSSVEGIVDPWRGLPDGTKCAAYAQAANSVAGSLGSSAIGGTVSTAGALGRASSTINTALVATEGAFKAPFVTKYCTRFDNIAAGLGSAAMVLAAHYQMQQEMWKGVRDDVMVICEAARATWAAVVAETEKEQNTIMLKAVSAVLAVGLTVATAGAGSAVALAGIGALATAATAASTALESVKDSTTVKGHSYDEIIKSLGESLDELNKAIRDQETALIQMLTDGRDAMWSNPIAFNLDAVVMDPISPTPASISVDKGNTDLVSTHMAMIADEQLAGLPATLGEPPASNPTPRNPSIGAGSAGTHYSAVSLYNTTAEYLQKTATEYATGKELFDAVIKDYFESDAASREVVKQLESDEALQQQS